MLLELLADRLERRLAERLAVVVDQLAAERLLELVGEVDEPAERRWARATRGTSSSAVTPRVCSVFSVSAWNGIGSRLASEKSSVPSSAWRWKRPSRPSVSPALSASARTLLPGKACDSLPMT